MISVNFLLTVLYGLTDPRKVRKRDVVDAIATAPAYAISLLLPEEVDARYMRVVVVEGDERAPDLSVCDDAILRSRLRWLR